MNSYLAEFIGTMILIVLGNGVVANVVLPKTKGHNSGWIVITFGWAMAVFVGVYSVAQYSGAHLNPAVTLALAAIGKFEFSKVLGYILAQVLGAILGAILIWIMYKDHFDKTENSEEIQACFHTGPAIKNNFRNFWSEIFATFIFIFAILSLTSSNESLGSIDALPVALLVLAIGLSLGGTTGYAINPARDLGPRIAHAILPIKHKGSSEWSYSWIPTFGPIIGGLLAAGLFYSVVA
jgi:glycerol uptake facilitator protein